MHKTILYIFEIDDKLNMFKLFQTLELSESCEGRIHCFNPTNKGWVSLKNSIFYFVFNDDEYKYTLHELNLKTNTTNTHFEFDMLVEEIGLSVEDIQFCRCLDENKHEDKNMS